jgi:starch synthase (maltosyl-transferring)
VWPNTPDILHEQLQGGEASVYMSRLVLAATLAASYGIYGPAYELREHLPREHGSEEYLDSEKYQLRHWNHDDPESLAPFIARVNRIRRENPALQWDRTLRFLHIDNPQLLAYAKTSADGSNVVVTVVNLDPHTPQSGWVGLEPAQRGREPGFAPSRCTTCSAASASSGRATGTTCGSIRTACPRTSSWSVGATATSATSTTFFEVACP